MVFSFIKHEASFQMVNESHALFSIRALFFTKFILHGLAKTESLKYLITYIFRDSVLAKYAI